MSKSKLNKALERYYKSFKPETGITAYKRGGQMGFRKFSGGGDEWIDEPDVDSAIRNYWNAHPKEYFKARGIPDSLINGSSFDFGDVKWGGLTGAATGLVSDTFSGFRDMQDRYNSISRQTNQYGTGAFNNISDNNALMAAAQNTARLSDVGTRDIRNKTVGQDIGSALTTGLNAGLSTGNVWVGLAATALDFAKSGAQRLQAKSLTDEANKARDQKNKLLDRGLAMSGQNVDANNDWTRMMSYYMNPFEYALGGEMRTHGSDFNNGFTFINEGGTHEQNPYEGVPSGIAEDGTPNLVEQGEVIWNNEYVFSNRIKIPSHLAKKYGLGGDLSFADAITKVTAESRERPNDPVSNETNRAIANEFMEEQEALREKEQMDASENLQQAYDEDFMNQLAMAQGQQMGPAAPMNLQLPNQVSGGEMLPMKKGGKKRSPRDRLVNASIGAAMAENPAVMTAAGWRTTPSGEIVQDAMYDPGVEQLRDNLSVLSTLSPTHPLNAALRGVNYYIRHPWGFVNETVDRIPIMSIKTVAENETNETAKKAFGGYKFQGGGDKWRDYYTVETDANGNKRYVAPDGVVQYSEAGAKKHYELNGELWIVPSVASVKTSTSRTARDDDNVEPVYSRDGRQFLGYRVKGTRGPVFGSYYAAKAKADGTTQTTQQESSARGRVILPEDNQATALDLAMDRNAIAQTVGANTNTEQPAITTASQSQRTNSNRREFAVQGNPNIRMVRENGKTIGYKIVGDKKETLYADYLSADKALYNKGVEERRAQRKARRESYSSKHSAAEYTQDRENKSGYASGPAETYQPSRERPVRRDHRDTQFTLEDIISSTGSNSVEAPVSQPTAAEKPATQTQSGTGQASGATTVKPASTSSTGRTSGGGSSTGQRIKPTATQAKEVENSANYKGLVDTMDKASDEDKQKFVDEINKSLPEGKKVKNYADWRKRATDGVWGSVHEATTKFIDTVVATSQQRQQVAPVVGPENAPRIPNTPADLANNVEQLGTYFKQNNGLAGGLDYRPTYTPPKDKREGTGFWNSNWAREAPIYGAGIMAANDIINGPNYENADAIIEAARGMGNPVNIPVQTIGDYVPRRVADVRYPVNIANQNRLAGARGVANTAGGNRSMDLLGNMSLAYNNQIDLGNIQMQRFLAQLESDMKTAEFNRGTNVHNMSAINARNTTQAQLNSQRQQAMLNGLAHGYGLRQSTWQDWRDDRDTNIDTFLENIGTWGRERESDSMVYSLAKELGYAYTYNPKTMQYEFVKQSAKGGNKKKRRF